MENSKKLEKLFKLMNHDSSHTKPIFDSFTLHDYNITHGTNYSSILEAVETDLEYLFT